MGTPRPAAPAGPRVALFPPVNLSGQVVSLPEVRTALEEALRNAGVNLVPRDELEAFLAKYRVRSMGGVHGEIAAAAAAELHVEGIVLASVDLYGQESSPRFGASLRLVSAQDPPVIRWAHAVSRTGDDSPGWFELGVLTTVAQVQQVVLAELARSLFGHLHQRVVPTQCAAERRFAPSAIFVAPEFDPARNYSVAVMPFINETSRRGAGELLSAEVVRSLLGSSTFTVVEPGAVREELLRYRIATEGGISLDTARVVLEVAHADLVVSGTVRRYEDGALGIPKVEFTAFALERANNEIVWQTSSRAGGDDVVVFFDLGKVSTARELSCRMVETALTEVMKRAAKR